MDGMLALRGAIAEALRGRKKNKNQIRRGTVAGGLVYINGRGYVYSAAVDINIVDGMSVWCEMSGTRAVIVGA
jgi:hypothetical protein